MARIPSLEEIVAEAEKESMQRVDRTRQVLKQGKDMAERMKNLAPHEKAQLYPAYGYTYFSQEKYAEGLKLIIGMQLNAMNDGLARIQIPANNAA